ncbi:MAG TPA: hypothetical protein DDY37_01970 [Legionella sp.]|nr:hypothetical protein [Legionella sp.]
MNSLKYTLMQHLSGSVTQQTPSKEEMVVAPNQFEENEQALTELLKILSEYIDQGQTQQLEKRLQILCANDPPLSSDSDIQRLRKLYSEYENSGIEIPGIPEIPADFLERLQLQNNIVTTISMIENMIVFIIEKSPEKTAAFLQKIAHVLSPEQRTLLFEIIKDRLLDLIISSDDFVKITRVLSPEQRIIVFDSIKSRLPQLANTYVDMREISTYLALGERAQVYPHNWYFLLEILDNMGIRHEIESRDRHLKLLAAFVVMQAAVLAIITQDPIVGVRQTLAGAGALAFCLPVVQRAVRAQVYTINWSFLLDVIATPLAQGAATVMIIAAAAAIITQEPMMVVQAAVTATAGFASAGFFSRKKPDPTMDEAYPDIGLGN